MTANPTNEDAPADSGGGAPQSREVHWYETFRFASEIAAQHGVVLDHRVLPVAGTEQWCGLPDDDARKLLSLLLGGVREALINDARQDAIHDAGEAVWAGADWSATARNLLRRHEIDELRKTA